MIDITIDEWIEKAKLNAKVNVEYPTDEMLLQEAEEYAQLAEWLEELKDYRERECNHINETLYDKCYSEDYNKAIDDFAELVEIWCWKHEQYNQDHLNDLMEIANKLKKIENNKSKNANTGTQNMKNVH